jgi:hypothetical protein
LGTSCISVLGSAEHRFALQITCQQFLRISNSDAMLVGVTLGGDAETGSKEWYYSHEHNTAASPAVCIDVVGAGRQS